MTIRASSNRPLSNAVERAARTLSSLFQGRPIAVVFRPDLRASRGRLLSGESKGQPVHAATYVRARRIVLEQALLKDSAELSRILAHELFHFVWVRLGNPARRSWEGVLEAEFNGRARGELGWSAEIRKQRLTVPDLRRRSKRWREYVCESFCDSAACVHLGVRLHAEFTLAPRYRTRRRAWFQKQQLLGAGRISI